MSYLGPPNFGRDTPTDYKNVFLTYFTKFWVASDPKWQLLNKSLLALFAVAIFPLYSIGQSTVSVRHIVEWIWEATIFGIFSDSSPYYCSNQYGLCSATSLDQQYWLYELSLLGACGLFIGGLISVRLITIVLQMFERATGINLIVGGLQKYLGGGSKKENGSPDKR